MTQVDTLTGCTTVSMLLQQGYPDIADAIAAGHFVPLSILDAIPNTGDGDWAALDKAIAEDRARDILTDVLDVIDDAHACGNDEAYDCTAQEAIDYAADCATWSEELAASPIMQEVLKRLVETGLEKRRADLADA